MKLPLLFLLREKLLSLPKRIFYLAFLGGFIGALLFTIIAIALFFGGRALWNTVDGQANSSVNSILGSESEVVQIVEETNPAVVSIIISREVPVVQNIYEEDPFGFLFPRQRQLGTEEKQIGGGSGFIVSPEGLVVTNKHVVSVRNATYTIFTQTGESYDMEIVDTDPFFDLAILRIKGARGDFPYLQFDDSDSIRLGESVIAIGNALGEFRNSVSVGVVSGLSRSIEASTSSGTELLEEVIQTDAAINPGNSGGPLLNSRGKVIGVNVAVASGVENIGFALPSNVAKQAVNSVQRFGRIARPYLGIRFAEVTEQIRQIENLSIDYGAWVSSSGSAPAIIPGSPADRAGVKEGDIIISIDGESLKQNSLSSIIRKKNIGDAITLEINRSGKIIELRVTLQESPDSV